jgi:ubiquinone biosynthesis protein UbiJ
MATRVHSANPALLHMRRQNVLKELTQVCQQIAQTQKQITRLEKRIVSLMRAKKKVA